jgi:hypothetical protein
MASAIAPARQQINDVGADGDLDGARAPREIDLDVDSVADPIELPTGRSSTRPGARSLSMASRVAAVSDGNRGTESPFRVPTVAGRGPPGAGSG